jgi:oligopeptide transport system substrate-binding protein
MAVAASCGSSNKSSATATPAGSTSSGGAPSGTITIAGTQFQSWDPHFANFAQDIAQFYMVWRGLYEFDLNSKPVPSMAAAAPTVSADGKTYTVKLKPGLKWSDGTPLTAADFVLGLQRTCNPDIAGNYEYILTAVVGCDTYYNSNGNPKATPPVPAKSATEKEALRQAMGVRAVDATTIEYKLTDPQPTFSELLAMWPTFPVPSSKVAKVDAAWPAPLDNAYNGPFMPSAYTEKSSIELVPNPNWSGAQKPQVAKIVIKYIDDLAVADNAYRNGELDATNVDSTQLAAIQKDPVLGKELVEYPATRTQALEFNLNDPILSKKEIRVALSRAVDRNTLNTVVLQGANVPPDRSGVPIGTYDSLLGYDVNAAKASLAASGLKASDINITLTLVDSAANHAVGEFLQSQWKTNLGINVNLEFTDSKTRSARYNSMTYQLVTGGWQEDYPDPENWMLGLFQVGSSQNKFGTNVPALDALLKQATYDQNDTERRQLYQQAEKVMLDGANGVAPLYIQGQHRLVKPYISGMKEEKRASDTFVPGDWNPEFWKTSKK